MRFRRIVISLCALFSIISAVIFAYQVYSFFEKTSNPIQAPSQNGGSQLPSNDLLRGLSRDSPPFLVYSFFGMTVSALACVAMIYAPGGSARGAPLSQTDSSSLAIERIESIKARLQPDAKKIIELLEQNNGEQTQSELVNRSGMGKLKVSRIIRKLESVKLVKKHPYGMTNLVVIEPSAILTKNLESYAHEP